MLFLGSFYFAGVKLGLLLALIAGRGSCAKLVDAGDELFLCELFVVRFTHFADLWLGSLVQCQEENELCEIDCS